MSICKRKHRGGLKSQEVRCVHVCTYVCAYPCARINAHVVCCGVHTLIMDGYRPGSATTTPTLSRSSAQNGCGNCTRWRNDTTCCSTRYAHSHTRTHTLPFVIFVLSVCELSVVRGYAIFVTSFSHTHTLSPYSPRSSFRSWRTKQPTH
jgi:hypothetical protein